MSTRLSVVPRPQRLLRVGLVIAALQFLGGAANYLLQRLVAARFGAGVYSDAYFVVIGSEILLAQTLSGILTFALLPKLIRTRKELGDAISWDLGMLVQSRAMLATATLSLVLAVSAPAVVSLLAPGFSGSTTATTASLLRFSLIGFVCYSSALAIGVVLQSYERFVSTALVSVLPMIGGVLAITLGPARYGVYVPVAGFGVGAVAALIIQLRNLSSLAASHRLRLTLRHPQASMLTGNLIPVSVAFVCSFFLPILQRMWASGMEQGSISSLSYATLVVAVPTALAIAPLTAMLLPRFSRLHVDGATAALTQLLKQTVVVVLLVGAAFGAIFAALPIPLVRVLLGGGNFDTPDVMRTAGVVAMLGAGVFAMAMTSTLSAFLVAAGEARAVARAWLVAIPVTLLLDVVLGKPLGVEGLGLVYSLAYVVQTVLLLTAVRRHLVTLDVRWVGLLFVRAALAGLVAVASARFVAESVQEQGALASLLLGGGACILTLSLSVWAMRGEEVALVRTLLPGISRT